MMFVSNVFITEAENDQSATNDYDEINKEISKALNEMDINKEETNENSYEFSFNHYEATASSLSDLNEPNYNEKFYFGCTSRSSNKNNSKCGNSPANSLPYYNSSKSSSKSSFTFNEGGLYTAQSQGQMNNSSYIMPMHYYSGRDSFNQFSNRSSFENFDCNQRRFTKKASKGGEDEVDYKKLKTISKSKKKNDDNSKNKIYLERILSLKDKRTTVMIKNIPNRFTLRELIDEINTNFLNKYDILYLPVDTENKCNLGFGFINFIDPLTIISFYDFFYGQRWSRFNSDKRCELAFAKVQGRDQLINYIDRLVVTEEETSYIQYDNTTNNSNKTSTNSELPLKYLQAFLNSHPYALYRIIRNGKFIVESYFNC